MPSASMKAAGRWRFDVVPDNFIDGAQKSWHVTCEKYNLTIWEWFRPPKMVILGMVYGIVLPT